MKKRREKVEGENGNVGIKSMPLVCIQNIHA